MKLALALSTVLAASSMVCTLASAASADPLVVGSDATIEKILTAQQGKVVTLRITGSEELTGKVKIATPEVVHLSELSGKEFFDAAVSTKSITAVVVRTR